MPMPLPIVLASRSHLQFGFLTGFEPKSLFLITESYLKNVATFIQSKSTTKNRNVHL